MSLMAALNDGDEQALIQLERDFATLSPGDKYSVIEQIQYHVRSSDPRTVRRLGSLTKSASGELQLAAAAVLARVHTKECLPFLAALLESSDAQLRAIGVGGIAMFANNVPIGGQHPSPGPWRYRTDDTMRFSAMDERILRSDPAILPFWKAWWSEHRVELAGCADDPALIAPACWSDRHELLPPTDAHLPPVNASVDSPA